MRARWPDFTFLAEAYWKREGDLLAQGFDLCYDKAFLDALVAGDVDAVREHVESAQPPPARLVRFLENHDEPRAAARLAPEPLRAASVMASTLPGGLLLLDGQLRGAEVQMPVQAARRPTEEPDRELERWWSVLLSALHDDDVRSGEWSPLTLEGWEDNRSYERLVAWQWADPVGRHVVVVNLCDQPADGLVRLAGTAGDEWSLTDLLDGQVYERSGDELESVGLYVRLPAWGQHVFRVLGAQRPGDRLTGHAARRFGQTPRRPHGPQMANVTAWAAWMLTNSVPPSGLNVAPANSSP